jgi:hypothetical protein
LVVWFDREAHDPLHVDMTVRDGGDMVAIASAEFAPDPDNKPTSAGQAAGRMKEGRIDT